MSLIEKIILIFAALIPIIALMMFLPKILKNRKNKQEQLAQPEKEQTQPTPTVQPIEQPQKTNVVDNEMDDFVNFAEQKKHKISAPKRNFPKPEFENFIERYTPPNRLNVQKKEKSVVEEISSLSPQLKALIMSGAFDRKDFDD